jgi:hypothetical protein
MGAARQAAAHPSHDRHPTPRPGGTRPSARRAADRRAHLLEQEVTLAYLRELAGPGALPGRSPL